jgi:hypothetical protein
MINLEMAETSLSDADMECLVQNFDARNLVPPLRWIRAKPRNGEARKTMSSEQRRAAVALQHKWESWLVRRDLLRAQIKRGKECLDQARKELDVGRTELEDWPAYERICGKNPLIDYMVTLSAKERIAKFLPGWLRRQQAELNALNRKMERCAKQNKLEHLL